MVQELKLPTYISQPGEVMQKFGYLIIKKTTRVSWIYHAARAAKRKTCVSPPALNEYRSTEYRFLG
jgi:hypothetical protein